MQICDTAHILLSLCLDISYRDVGVRLTGAQPIDLQAHQRSRRIVRRMAKLTWLQRLKRSRDRRQSAGTADTERAALDVGRTHTGTYINRALTEERGEYCSHCDHCKLIAARRKAREEEREDSG